MGNGEDGRLLQCGCGRGHRHCPYAGGRCTYGSCQKGTHRERGTDCKERNRGTGPFQVPSRRVHIVPAHVFEKLIDRGSTDAENRGESSHISHYVEGTPPGSNYLIAGVEVVREVV